MTRTANHSAVSNLAIASLDTYRVPERISVAVRLLRLSRTGPSHSIFFLFQRRDRSAGEIPTTRPSAVSHLVMASLDMNRVLEKTSVAVRLLWLS